MEDDQAPEITETSRRRAHIPGPLEAALGDEMRRLEDHVSQLKEQSRSRPSVSEQQHIGELEGNISLLRQGADALVPTTQIHTSLDSHSLTIVINEGMVISPQIDSTLFPTTGGSGRGPG